MKKFILFITLTIASFSFAQSQNLPQVVQNSFKKIFPSQVISSWTGNNLYSYTDDWDYDQYFGDYNLDGYPDDYEYNNFYEYNNSFINSYYYDDDDDAYEYNVPENYVQEAYSSPTQYQINFVMNGANMTSIFKSNGSFIIAKGRINRLPIKVRNTVLNAFKGKVFRFSNIREEMITPTYTISNPVYRFKVKIKHAYNHILKIDSNGKIISNNKI